MKPDFRLENALIITMNPQHEVIHRGFVEITGNAISAIGPMSQAHLQPEPVSLMSLHNRLVMPGLINCHTHAAMTLLRGVADDLPLDTWLRDYIWPAEAKMVTPENVFLGTQLAIAEMFQSGTTLFADMYFFEEQVIRACEEAGMRVMAGEAVVNFPSPSHPTPEGSLQSISNLADQYRNHPLVSIAYAPHSLYACSKETLNRIAIESRRLNLPVHIHLSETSGEVETCLAQTGLRPLPYLVSAGLGEKLIAAHMIHPDEEEIHQAAALGIGIANNPSSNLKLASGWAPVEKFVEAGIACGLGTDGSASNNNLDLFTEMRMTALVTKLINKDPSTLPAPKVLEMATLGGARVLGLDKIAGSLEVGKAADILIARLDQPHLTPCYNIWSHVVYAMHAADVESLFVNGRLVMHQREILTFDAHSVIARANMVQSGIAETLKTTHGA